MSQTKAQLIDPVDGTIVNADINASAAILGSKISPDFGSQNIVTTGSISGAAGTFTGDVTIPDTIVHTGDSDTKIRFSGADQVKVETAGTERVHIDGVEVVFNQTGVNTDFRIEGDTDANLFKVDAGNDRIGIGTATPTPNKFHVVHSDYQVALFENTNADANGSYIEMYANSSSPADNDVIGLLSFRGNNSASENTLYTTIRSIATDVTDGTEDGDITFQTRLGGTMDERIRIDSAGRLLVGTTSPVTTDANGHAKFVAVSSAGPNIQLGNNTTDIDNNTRLGTINYSGNHGSTFRELASIRSAADEDHTSSSCPSRLEFYTTGTGNTGPTERVRIDKAGNVGIGATSITANTNYSTLQIQGQSGNGGGILRLMTTDGSTSKAMIFADTGGLYIRQETNHNIIFENNNQERFRLGNSGQFGIAGANYGNAGEALVSQGASAAPQWATVSSITTGSRVALSGTNQVFGSIPATAIIVRILFQNLFSSGSGRPMFRVGHAGSGGTLLTSGYKGYTGYVYRNQTYSPNNDSNSTMIPVVSSGWAHSSYKWNGYIDFIRVDANASNQSQSWITETYLRENNSNYWDSVSGTQYNVYFYGQSQIYMGDNISLDRIELNANGSSSGQTLGGGATLQYFE